MTNLLVRWLVSAVSLLAVPYLVSDVTVTGFLVALKAAPIIGLLNATLGKLIKFFGFPIRLITLGLFSLVVNAAMLYLASNLVDGFVVKSVWGALFGSVVLSLVSTVLGWIVPDFDGDKDEKKK